MAALLCGFIGEARRTIAMAVYDLVLEGAAEQMLHDSLATAIRQGVQVRLVYNQDRASQSRIPPPPKLLGAPSIRDLEGLEHRSVPGVPDLMHHKYVVIDGDQVWTGSTNWTNDSWTREENVIVRVRSEAVAAAYGANFEELWERRDVGSSGHQPPEWTALADGTRVRAYFTPGRAMKLVHELCQRVQSARRRLRICSPVLTSGPLLGTLCDMIERGLPSDVRGVLDWTQMREARRQWAENHGGGWKLHALDRVLGAVPFAGKHSTPWGPATVHDFMHAKCLVADDCVFVGSYNLSRSGEFNAENVLEIENSSLADMFAAYVDRVAARYPPIDSGDVGWATTR